MRIYFDVCSLHRPLDDQSQARIRLETEAVLLALELCGTGSHQWVVSDAIEWEIARNPDVDKRRIVLALLRFADERLSVSENAIGRARALVAQGFGANDAVHLAIAEIGRCDVILTTDSSFLSRARNLIPASSTRAVNPAEWILEVGP